MSGFLSLCLLADAHRCGLTDCGFWKYSRFRYRDKETIQGKLVLDNFSVAAGEGCMSALF